MIPVHLHCNHLTFDLEGQNNIFVIPWQIKLVYMLKSTPYDQYFALYQDHGEHVKSTPYDQQFVRYDYSFHLHNDLDCKPYRRSRSHIVSHDSL